MTRPSETLHAALLTQSRACGNLGSPFMARLLKLLAARLEPEGMLGQRLFSWTGELGPAGHSVPLRLAGGLHAIVLETPQSALAQAYPPNSASDEQLWKAISDVLHTRQEFLLNWLDNAPQTNEVRRSAALIPVGHILARKFGLPLILSELGASAGLNLNFDHYALDTGQSRLGPDDATVVLTPDWTGHAPQKGALTIAARRGVDINPLTTKAQQQRLRAYIWPDQPERMALSEAALRLPNCPVDKGDAAPWLEARLSQIPAHQTHLIYHTVAWQYFPDETKAKLTATIEAQGAEATAQSPLAWFMMEDAATVNAQPAPGAALLLRLWPGDQKFFLGHADFHGRWIKWHGFPEIRFARL